jgi:hypothetical protein
MSSCLFCCHCLAVDLHATFSVINNEAAETCKEEYFHSLIVEDAVVGGMKIAAAIFSRKTIEANEHLYLVNLLFQ